MKQESRHLLTRSWVPPFHCVLFGCAPLPSERITRSTGRGRESFHCGFRAVPHIFGRMWYHHWHRGLPDVHYWTVAQGTRRSARSGIGFEVCCHGSMPKVMCTGVSRCTAEFPTGGVTRTCSKERIAPQRSVPLLVATSCRLVNCWQLFFSGF